MTAAAPASASSIFDCRVAVAAPFLRPHRRRPLLCRRGPPGAPADGQPPRARRVAPPVSGRDVAGGRARRADPAARRREALGRGGEVRCPGAANAADAAFGRWCDSAGRRSGRGQHPPPPGARQLSPPPPRAAARCVCGAQLPLAGRRADRRVATPAAGGAGVGGGGAAAADAADAAAVGNALVAVAVAALPAGTRGGPRVAVAATRQLRARATAGRVWGRRGRRWANRPRWVDRCPPT